MKLPFPLQVYGTLNQCNQNVDTKSLKVLKELFAFIHHEIILVQVLANEKAFYGKSIRIKPADVNLHRKGIGWVFLIKMDRFQLVSLLFSSFPSCFPG